MHKWHQSEPVKPYPKINNLISSHHFLLLLLRSPIQIQIHTPPIFLHTHKKSQFTQNPQIPLYCICTACPSQATTTTISSPPMASTACFLHHHALTTAARSSASPRHVAPPKPAQQLICRAHKHHPANEDDGGVVSRRLALTVLIGAAALGSKVSPADAAYGEAANVFGKPKSNTDYLPYNGDGFKLSIPAKWNPSREREFPGQVLRYEDNFDSNSNVSVIINPTDKKSIIDYGSPEEFLSKVDFLLGKQAYSGKTASEGGFDVDAVATANVLESSVLNVDGKPYYFLSVLTRTADGDEGGKHQLITAAVKDGKLYICKAQAGDKRWFKGARKFVEGAASSFSVA